MAALAALSLSAAPALAQRAVRPRPQPRREQRQEKQAARDSERTVQSHAGDWLRRYKNLPPDQERILSRMETWEHLTREQKQQAKGLFQQIQQLPPQRRRMLSSAVRDMRELTPEQRDQLINSDRYRNMFSDHERELLSGAARLPLAPGDAGQAPPPDE